MWHNGIMVAAVSGAWYPTNAREVRERARAMEAPAQLLIVSPDTMVLEAVGRCLQSLGHSPHPAIGLPEAQRFLSRVEIDALLLDTVLPEDEMKRFWYWLCTERDGSLPPATIFLVPPSAALAPGTLPAFYDRRRHGLVTKPLATVELAKQVARVLAGRARLQGAPELLRAGSVTLDCISNQLLFSGEGAVCLTPTESRLLRYLMERSEQFVQTEELLSAVWGYPPGTGGPEVLRAHVSNVRRKLRKIGQDPQLLRTMPYHGYGFAVRDPAAV